MPTRSPPQRLGFRARRRLPLRCAEKWEMNKSQIQYASMPWTLYERRSRKATASVLGREKMTWSSSACSSACKLFLVYRNGCILFILQDL